MELIVTVSRLLRIQDSVSAIMVTVAVSNWKREGRPYSP